MNSLASAAQPPDECPDRDTVDVQDVLGEVDPNGLVLSVVTIRAQIHVVRAEPHSTAGRCSPSTTGALLRSSRIP